MKKITILLVALIFISLLSASCQKAGEQEGKGQGFNLSFYDSKGNLLSEYSGFRNMSIGKLSDEETHPLIPS